MPQVDQATFFPIVFWMLITYSGGYLLLSVYALPSLNASNKLLSTYYRLVGLKAELSKNLTAALTFAPWVALDI